MKSKLFIVALQSLIAASTTQMLHAGSHTWSGATSGLWSVAGNWSAGGRPTNGESPLHLTFPSGALRYITTNDITGLQLDSLTINTFGYDFFASPGKSLTLKSGTNIFCNDNASFDVSFPFVLSGTNYIKVGTNVEMTINGPISGNGALAKIGIGQLNFHDTPANSYTGATLVLLGTLQCKRGISAQTPAIAVPGPLVIGTSNAVPNGAGVHCLYSDQIQNNVTPTILSSGALYLESGVVQTVSSLILVGGYTSGAVNTLLTLRGNILADATDAECGIYGPLSLGGTNRSFDVGGSGFRSLHIAGAIRDGGNNAGFIKTGGGTLELAASNTYGGLTIIQQGQLVMSHPFALGSTNGGTIISNGASIRLLFSFAVGAEPLTLNGSGFLGNGAIYADEFNNSWAGPVTLATDSVVQVLTSQGAVTFLGPIIGPGGFQQIGKGKVVFSGTSTNTFAGPTVLLSGRLELSKTNATAIPSALFIGDNETPTNNSIVQIVRSNQIADLAPVTILHSGLLNFDPISSPSETIGSLNGSGLISLGLSTLTVGANNSDSVFDGNIGGVGFVPLVKTGFGTLTLNGTNTCSGTTTVNGGKLMVNGVLPGFLKIDLLSFVGGTGTVGHVTGGLAHLAPGNSVGRMTTGNLTLFNGSSSLDVQLNGTTPAVNYDQLNVAGSVNLTNPTLNVAMNFVGAPGNQYVIVANDGSDPVVGIFKGLPEGTNFMVGAAQFQITYKGGSGSNDVVLTQITAPGSLQFGGITKLGNGSIQLSGIGVPAASYTIEANTNLSTTNWMNIGIANADPQTGALSFTDPNATSFPTRFYRFRGN
jgi:autotransporter-associated beta strand protein